MIKYIFLSFILISKLGNAQVKTSLEDIPVNVFVNDGNTNVESIMFDADNTKSKVKILFDKKEIIHELTGPNSSFDRYWEAFGSQWKWVRFRKNESPILLFTGLNSYTDEREFVELYDPELEKSRLFAESGRIIAFKRHPLTNELILYTHKYPCCRYSSHNIFTIRYINKEIKSKDRFFVGRDSGDMVGPFFPDSVSFDGKYKRLEEKTLLRWSPKIVETNAFLERAHTNAIIHYEKGALYKELARQGEWIYVLMLNGISEEASAVINHVNFTNKGVYGWIKSEP